MDYQDALDAHHRREHEEALPAMLEFAQAGHAEAQCIVGTYLEGLFGGRADREEARRWYELSSRQGYGIASNNLGTMALADGNEELARYYYDKARSEGFVHSPRL
jgi:TPR repeat protein